MARSLASMVSLTAVAALLAPVAALAQSVGYGDVTGSDAGASTGDDGGDAGMSTKRERHANGQRDSGRGGGKTIQIQPYIELNQIVDADLSSGGDVLTYTQAAAGVDAAIAGRNNALSASVRYEYHQGWSKRAGHGDSISGIVSGYTRVAPGLTLNVAGLAARTNDSGERGGFGGGIGGGSLGNNGNSTVYAVQGGPSYVGRVGDLDLSASYRAGYTRVDTDNSGRNNASTFAPDLFDESVTHVADAEAGFAPGTVLPVGVGVAGSFYQENVTNLDQRLRDMQARAIVTVPVSRSLQASGAIGYEDVEVSAHDAVRDASGVPIIRHGRYVTDKSGPRLIAYDTDGLIWDVGVSWRPSRRTSLTAHVGRRYGAMNYSGSFSWAPSARQTLSVGVYNTISAFGGNLGRVLDDLPDDFVAVRNPISGELGGCVSSLQGNNCLTGAFTSLRSSTFRSRGIAATYSVRFGAIDAGLGIGYDNRKYIAAPGTVLAGADGQVDENYWLSANLNWAIDERSGLYTNAYADLSKSDAYVGDISNVGITTAYYRNLTNHLRAHAALGIDGTLGSGEIDDYWNASALVGMRYNF